MTLLRSRTSAATVESRALMIAIGAFLAAGIVGMVAFGATDVPLAGRGSLGDVTAVTTGVLAIVVFIVGYLLSFAEPGREWLRSVKFGRQVLDIGALSFAHGVVCLLLWAVIFHLLQAAFLDAVLFPLAAAALLGSAAAISAYFVFLSATGMTTSRVAIVLVIFLLLGMLTTMLTASDPHWWQKNISALGMNDDGSSAAFNLTLIVGGIIITTLANYMTTELEHGTLTRSDASTTDDVALRRARYVKFSLVLIGVFLACVGIFPVDEAFWVHNSVATGMAVVYAVLVIRLRWVVPGLPQPFFIVGYVFLAVIVAAGVAFGVGYYNLTATEIIAFALIFSWLVVLIRNVSAAASDAAGASGSNEQPVAASAVSRA